MISNYALIDSGNFSKLERIGQYTLIRPSPQAVWEPAIQAEWAQVDATYQRFTGGDGEWTFHKPFSGETTIRLADINFLIEPTDFGHLGVFPEQEANWSMLQQLLRERQATTDGKELHVLNLFGYTGGSTFAAAKGGAHVVHVDASKTSVAWARRNAQSNDLSNAPIRWIIEDVQKFVAREVRRGNKYQGIILDPPSFGRGAKGETWKIEEHLTGFLNQLKQLIADDLLFVLMSAHSNGYTPLAMRNLLGDMTTGFKGHFVADEMVIHEQNSSRCLPSGAFCCFIRDTVGD